MEANIEMLLDFLGCIAGQHVQEISDSTCDEF